jgi:hypothetical protein
VRRLLGMPGKIQHFELQHEEVWDWRYADSTEARVFSVTFDTSGRVTSTGNTAELGVQGH